MSGDDYMLAAWELTDDGISFNASAIEKAEFQELQLDLSAAHQPDIGLQFRAIEHNKRSIDGLVRAPEDSHSFIEDVRAAMTPLA